MSDLSLLASLAAVQLLAAMSPGPAFALVVSRSAAGDRRRAVATATGILSATALWIALALAGAGALLAAAPALYAACRAAGAAYLIWTGLKMLRAAVASGASVAAPAPAPGLAACWRQGLFTNIANPKSVAYYTSLFIAMLPLDAPGALLLGAGATAWLTSAVWWFGLAALFTTPAVARGFLRFRRLIDAAMGVVMVGLGLRLLAAR